MNGGDKGGARPTRQRPPDAFEGRPERPGSGAPSGYHAVVAHAVRSTEAEADRRRAAGRMRGLFADVAAERSLVDELIAERRAEARAEARASEGRPRQRGR